jgi:hypothetical protein
MMVIPDTIMFALKTSDVRRITMSNHYNAYEIRRITKEFDWNSFAGDKTQV